MESLNTQFVNLDLDQPRRQYRHHLITRTIDELTDFVFPSCYVMLAIIWRDGFVSRMSGTPQVIIDKLSADDALNDCRCGERDLLFIDIKCRRRIDLPVSITMRLYPNSGIDSTINREIYSDDYVEEE